MFQETSYHVRSNEVAENVDERRKQRFERRAHGGRTVTLDAADDVQVNAGGIGTANILQHGVVRLGSGERSHEQRAVTILTHGAPQVVGHARARSLHRRAEPRRLRRARHVALEQLPSHRTRGRRFRGCHADVRSSKRRGHRIMQLNAHRLAEPIPQTGDRRGTPCDRPAAFQAGVRDASRADRR